MGVKKTFTATAKHTIYYQYRCCHCGKDSGVNTYEFVENKSQTKHGTFIDPKLSPAEEEELHASARKALIERIEKERTNVSNGNYNSVIFKGKCPHCKKHQPWAGGTYMDSVLKVSLACTAFVGIYLFLPLLLVIKIIDVPFLTGYLAAVAASFLIPFVYRGCQWFLTKKSGASAKTKMLPVIAWNGL